MLCAEPARARAVGAAAAEEARARFGIDREAERLAAVYRELLGSP
jgi:mannosyltransferase